jgi:hypothetical protein
VRRANLATLLLDSWAATHPDATRARVMQVMGMLGMAPEIQEALLCSEPPERDYGRLAERAIRPVVTLADWNVSGDCGRP